jgi:hypothetical protein
MSRLKKVECVEIVGIGKVPIKDGTFRPSGEKRETKMSTCNAKDSGFVGTNESAQLKITILSHGYIDAQTLHKQDNAQITVTLAGGNQHIMYPAWSTELPEEKDGEFEITFEAGTSERIK